MKKVFINLCTLLCVLAVASCTDDGKSKGKEYDPNKPVVLTSFYPDSGRIAEKVILDGENFGTDPDKIKVYFNNKISPVIGTTGKRMYVVVPRLPGDTCNVSVVVGNDSVTYEQQFKYKVSVSVKTIVGNGTEAYKPGTLDEATIGKPKYLIIDNDDNLFVAIADGGTWGVVKINEEENSVITLASSLVSSIYNCQVLSIDLVSGIVATVDDGIHGQYYYFDPKEGWAPRIKTWKWKEGSTNLPTNTWKKSIVYCPYDGFSYVHHYNGQLVKLNTKTNEGEIVFRTAQADCFGMAFHPLNPKILYLVFNNSTVANTIWTLDITDPDNTYQKLCGTTAAGHRDGPLDVAQFNAPRQVFFDQDGNLYIADYGNHCIRRLNTAEGIVETVVGIPGQAGWKDGGKEDALFRNPTGIVVGKDGSVYVADYNNSRMRKLAIE